MNIIFNSLLVQLVKYDVHTTRKIKFIHAIFYHILFILRQGFRKLSSDRQTDRRNRKYICLPRGLAGSQE